MLRAFGTLDPRNFPDQITELANYGEVNNKFLYQWVADFFNAIQVMHIWHAYVYISLNICTSCHDVLILIQDDITKLAEFYCSPKEDQFQGHMVRVPSDLQSPQAAVAEFRGFKTHMFVERYVKKYIDREQKQSFKLLILLFHWFLFFSFLSFITTSFLWANINITVYI